MRAAGERLRHRHPRHRRDAVQYARSARIRAHRATHRRRELPPLSPPAQSNPDLPAARTPHRRQHCARLEARVTRARPRRHRRDATSPPSIPPHQAAPAWEHPPVVSSFRHCAGRLRRERRRSQARGGARASISPFPTSLPPRRETHATDAAAVRPSPDTHARWRAAPRDEPRHSLVMPPWRWSWRAPRRGRTETAGGDRAHPSLRCRRDTGSTPHSHDVEAGDARDPSTERPGHRGRRCTRFCR